MVNRIQLLTSHNRFQEEFVPAQSLMESRLFISTLASGIFLVALYFHATAHPANAAGNANTFQTDIAQSTGPNGPDLSASEDANILDAASLLIGDLTEDGLAILTNLDLDAGRQREFFRKMFEKSFATEEIGRIVLGRYWNDANEDERAEFLTTLGGILAGTLIERLPADGIFEIIGATEISAPRPDESRIQVTTNFVSVDLEAQILWTVIVIDGDVKVLDAFFAGRSFLLAQRSTFMEILQRVDGSVTALVAELES